MGPTTAETLIVEPSVPAIVRKLPSLVCELSAGEARRPSIHRRKGQARHAIGHSVDGPSWQGLKIRRT
ncbi:MAG TPA: hypothetical protein VKR06_16910 [Ktedonosporobacter sp.]|nr:hypothetical protein [Ktedonosporobacter sp.]